MNFCRSKIFIIPFAAGIENTSNAARRLNRETPQRISREEDIYKEIIVSKTIYSQGIKESRQIVSHPIEACPLGRFSVKSPCCIWGVFYTCCKWDNRTVCAYKIIRCRSLVWNCIIDRIHCYLFAPWWGGKRYIITNYERIMYTHSGRVDIVKFISIMGMLGGLLLILMGIGLIWSSCSR